ncbi:intraflagellar transport protein 57 [Nesidiocoris tenuis]|uniref:Intraflagellar transport protein 57 n=1 Tax=Nesidiocoris tenuis TaxID=355587 RepID=A0ABN7AR41_9HEMI|nr:intraflagellar transport protein 57 [Nesidiocoris tenuis]
MSSAGSRVTTAEDDPGFNLFETMEDLLEKLKMLNYDEEFIKSLKMRPLNRLYFAIQTNPGEQFFMFVSLCAWLLKKIGMTFSQPQEDDDPNSTISSILDALRSMEVNLDFPPNKLKKGSGYYPLLCISNLVDMAMRKQNIGYKKPAEPTESVMSDNTVEVEGEADLALDRVEEDFAFDEDSDFDEDNELDVDDLYMSNAYIETVKVNEPVESDVTAEEWQLELERVMPLLKVSIKTNSGDWRSHLDMMKTHHSSLSEISSLVTSNLGKISIDIENALQKMSKREKLINNQFELLLTQYRALQDELAAVNERYREVNVGVVERQKTLNSLTDQLESVKQEMDERGATMSDGSPLVHIKKALKDIKKEIFEMDINIAVAEHVIVESKLRDKSLESHLIRSSGFS